jgi:hypothetical protein
MVMWNSNYDQTIPFSDVCVQLQLVQGAELTYTVPGASTVQYSVNFPPSDTAAMYISINTTLVAPPNGTVTQLQYDEFRPGFDGSRRYVKGGDVIHFLSLSVANVFYGISLRQVS